MFSGLNPSARFERCENFSESIPRPQQEQSEGDLRHHEPGTNTLTLRTIAGRGHLHAETESAMPCATRAMPARADKQTSADRHAAVKARTLKSRFAPENA